MVESAALIMSINKPRHPYKDKTGQRYGMLTVLSAEYPRQGKQYRWHCQCDCGNPAIVRGAELRKGGTRSCGCLLLESRKAFVEAGITHDRSYDPLYNVWSGMIRRCEDSHRDEYERYGARDIQVCPRWRESFEMFTQDMGPRPSSRHTIERVDNDKDYEPANCRWASRIEQANNRRDTIRINVRGENLTLTEAIAKYSVVSRRCLESRLRNGWNSEEALFTPTRSTKHKTNHTS